ncbi:MAG: DUF5671 domain-containing protein [Patescibacteria group bacterium]
MENQNIIRSTPKDVFLQLFNILTFYLSVIGFITLFIQYVNALFPDTLNYYFTGIADTVRIASSILLIAVPAFLFTAWLLAKDLLVEPQKRELKLRKWLIYFTLFVSAVTIVVDLITFVYNFLSGELTTRFFLKIFVVLLVAGAVFGYYMWDLKRKELVSNIPKILAVTLSVIVLGSVVAGFFIIGTPFAQRNRRFDEQRVQDLQMLQNQLLNYWTQKGVLPDQILLLNDSISGFVVPTDPKSKQAYEYRVIDQQTFELCADFAVASDKNSMVNSTRYAMPYDSFNQNWDHQVGRGCFNRKIDSELYKPQTSDVNVKLFK